MKRLLPVLTALSAGIAAGYFIRGGAERADTRQTEPRRDRGKTIADSGDKAALKALRRRVAELERLLAGSGQSVSNAVADAAAAPERRERRNHRNPLAWIDNFRRMKTEDPERYSQMTNRFAAWRRGRAEKAKSAIEFLSSIDVSRMGAKARATHDALQELIVRRDELDAELHREDTTDERRAEIFRELRETHGEMARLNGVERENLIMETARNLGFGDEDAGAIADTISEVIRATDSGFGGGRPGGRRDQPPPPPPAR